MNPAVAPCLERHGAGGASQSDNSRSIKAGCCAETMGEKTENDRINVDKISDIFIMFTYSLIQYAIGAG